MDANSCQDVLAYAEAWEALDGDAGHVDFDQMDPEDLEDFLADLRPSRIPWCWPTLLPIDRMEMPLGQLRTNELVMGSSLGDEGVHASARAGQRSF